MPGLIVLKNCDNTIGDSNLLKSSNIYILFFKQMTELKLNNPSTNVELTLVDMETIFQCIETIRIDSPEWYEKNDELQEDVKTLLNKIYPQYRVLADEADNY